MTQSSYNGSKPDYKAIEGHIERLVDPAQPDTSRVNSAGILMINASQGDEKLRSFVRTQLAFEFARNSDFASWVAEYAPQLVQSVGGLELMEQTIAEMSSMRPVSVTKKRDDANASTVDIDLPLDVPPPAPAGVQLADAEVSWIRKPTLNGRRK